MTDRFKHLRDTMATYLEAKKYASSLHPCFREYDAFAHAATDVVADLLAIADNNSRNRRQQDAIEAGFKYWRASDAHGITGTKEQAESFIADRVGVEVDILLPTPRSPGRKAPVHHLVGCLYLLTEKPNE
jgi:hypothetical protein